VQIGVKLPNSGAITQQLGIPEMAHNLEQAGFDSLWVADHIVLPREVRSPYPFAPDGRVTWATDTPYFDALIALALAAAVTERVRLGTAVLVLPQRNPVQFAKQAASIDVASGGRLELGVGAGWLAEEFTALGVPFERRAGRLVEWMRIARACWTGTPPAMSSERYELPEGTLCLPRPAHDIPLFVGGHSPAALRRAGRVGDGWLGQQSAGALDPDALAQEIAQVTAASEDERQPRIVLRIVESLDQSQLVAQRLGELAEAGVHEVIVDAPADDPQGAARALAELRAGSSA
jgi:probable F420-dependent oxidoreductase